MSRTCRKLTMTVGLIIGTATCGDGSITQPDPPEPSEYSLHVDAKGLRPAGIVLTVFGAAETPQVTGSGITGTAIDQGGGVWRMLLVGAISEVDLLTIKRNAGSPPPTVQIESAAAGKANGFHRIATGELSVIVQPYSQ